MMDMNLQEWQIPVGLQMEKELYKEDNEWKLKSDDEIVNLILGDYHE